MRYRLRWVHLVLDAGINQYNHLQDYQVKCKSCCIHQEVTEISVCHYLFPMPCTFVNETLHPGCILRGAERLP